MVRYRPVEPSEAERYERIREYAFHPDEGPSDDVTADRDSPGERYGLFDDGSLCSICRQYTFDARLRGTWIRLGGLGTVATPPERRRQGYARRLLSEAVRTYAADSVPLVALWPFETAFYRQFGWTTAHDLSRYQCDPGVLVDVGDGTGQFQRVEADDWESLRTVHLTAGEGETLSLDRSERWWRRRVFSEWGETQRHVYRYDRGGDPAGYLAHSVDDGRLEVAALGGVDHDAYRAVLGFLGDHDAQIERVSFARPSGADLFAIVDDPDAIECTVEPGPMVRVTDVARALETVPYPDAITAEVTLAVEDPLLERNDGRYRLRVADGVGKVEAVPGSNPDATLSVGDLTALIVGSHDASMAARLGTLTVDDPAVVHDLDRLFPPERVFLREFF